MKRIEHRFFSLLSVMALTVCFSISSSSQESDDAMDELMSAPAEEAAPATKSADGVIDMRAAAPPAAAPIQSSPKVDKLEALMIAEAEMKVFMKAGGLKSRKLK